MKYNIQCLETHLGPYDNTEAAVQRCSFEKVFSKYAANLQKNTHAEALKLQSNFIEIALRHGCSPVNLLYIFRTPFPKNTSRWLLLKIKPFVKIVTIIYICIYIIHVFGVLHTPLLLILTITLGKICQNAGFLWPVYSCIRTKS